MACAHHVMSCPALPRPNVFLSASSDSSPGRNVGLDFLKELEEIIKQDLNEGVKAIDNLYRDPGVLPCQWFTDETEPLVAPLLARVTTTMVSELALPWNGRASAFDDENAHIHVCLLLVERISRSCIQVFSMKRVINNL